MASRALAAVARHPDDYANVYDAVLSQVRQPVILHWLGPMFDPALEGYWGARDIAAATENCLRIINAHPAKIDGIKISMLDADLEIAMRRRLPQGVRMYTGDDFNYDRLILGDSFGHSDALLGILDAIAPAASLALTALDAGDIPRYQRTSRAHGSAFPSLVYVSHAALQDGRCLSRLAEWISVSFPHGGRV